MQHNISKTICIATAATWMLLATQAHASDTAKSSADHSHAHAHDTSKDAEQIAKGYFEDAQVQPRSLDDWQGSWQSVYPLLQDGTLDEVLQHKAEHSDKSVQDYRDMYETGYRTETYKIDIKGNSFTFFHGDTQATAQYAADGYEILTYKKGNRGVRFIFVKTEGDDAAPQYVQFSDHIIAPQKAGHFHLYWGQDRAALLQEITNWPTYFPADLSGEQIKQEMLAH